MNNPSVTFAFQPIVDIERGSVFAYEALVRGRAGESAGQIFAALAPESLYQFDHQARLSAVALAARLGLQTKISLNLLPRSLEEFPQSIDELLQEAERHGVSHTQLLLEVTEGQAIERPKELAETLNRYRSNGVRLAIDDFGAGYSGLNLLADFQPDFIKLDMHLVRNIECAGPRQAIARAVLQVCDDLGIETIAEGVETAAEYRWFRRLGVRLFQGFWFGRPAFEKLEPISLQADA